MSFAFVIKSGVKMLIAWAIGALIILFGAVLFWQGLTKGFGTNNSGVMVTTIISLIICFIGVLVIWYYGNKYNIKLSEGYTSRTKHFDY